MRLRTIRFGAFRHFLDQRLDLDSEVTVLVGRNDTGKTCVLNNFMRNFYGQTMVGTDGPRLPGVADPSPRQKYSLEWDLDGPDHAIVERVFSVTAPVQKLVAAFDEERPHGWTYEIDGAVFDSRPVRHRDLFPIPSYVHVAGPDGPRDRLLPHRFAAQFTRLVAAHLEVPTHPDQTIPIEGVLARLAGFNSHTRRIPGPGADEPWEHSLPVPGPAIAELNDAFRRIGLAVTEQLDRWWGEPRGLEFNVSVVGNESRNSYWVATKIKTSTGMTMQGAGIRWFVALALELLFLKAVRQRCLLLFDEPGVLLHPSAQRAIVGMLAAFAAESGSQLIYSTHSPFMLDWSFPQRIRLFDRNYQTGRAAIINNPYHPGNTFATVWDPLWSTIGVTLGDLSQIGEANVFVEGVSDQIVLANASADARSRMLPYLDLPRTSIVPFGDHQALERLLAAVRERPGRSVAVIDTDRRSADSNVEQFRDAGIPCVRLDQFSDTPSNGAAIEDVIGVDDYVRLVNEFYAPFDWFRPIDAHDVRRKRGVKTLGRYLSEVFDQSGQSFSKVRVATALAAALETLSPATRGRLDRLVMTLSRTLAGTTESS